MRRFADRRTFRFDVAPGSLWREVSDTATLARDAGLPAARFAYEPGPGGLATAVGHGRIGPLPLAWEEAPPHWETPHRISVERRLRGPHFLRFFSDARIVADGGGARVEHAVELDARSGFGALLAPVVMARVRAGFARAYAAAARRARERPDGAARWASVPDVPPASVARTTRFVDALEALQPHTEHEPEIAARLAALVEHANDAFVARMRPYALADAWALPRERVLAAMLAAAHGALLEPLWSVVCPSCRTSQQPVPSLDALASDVRCEPCGIAYRAELDRNVELTFRARRPHGAATVPAYAAGGPQIAPQTRAQTIVPAAGTAALDVSLPRGAYDVHVLPERSARFTVEADAGAAVLDVRIEERRVRPATSVVQAGRVRLQLWNLTARDAVVRITEAQLSGELATAAEVTAQQAFRDFFPGEVPGAGMDTAIRSLTFVVADVVGSTRMYADAGDAHAYERIVRIAAALRETIALQRGALVKTAGDALMAVFADPLDALEAAVRFGESAAPLPLRIGVHSGPCVVVRANDRLDYAGATVNLAVRIARAARGGEVLLTSAVADDLRVAPAIAGAERGIVALRGIVKPADVVRLRPPVALAR